MEAAHQVLCVKPRTISMKWSKKQPAPTDITSVIEDISLPQPMDNATVLVKNFSKISEITPFMKHYYRPIFNAELVRMSDIPEHWPKMSSLKTFNQYFEVDAHTQLVHLH